MLIYLLHFNTPIHHAGHYLGSTNNIQQRLADHATGNAARITEVAAQRDLDWQLAKVWQPTPRLTLRSTERLIKQRHNGSVFCPLCHKQPTTPKHCRAYPLHALQEIMPTTRRTILDDIHHQRQRHLQR
jgi:predicted GIY-YIG superfamily endonuclease